MTLVDQLAMTDLRMAIAALRRAAKLVHDQGTRGHLSDSISALEDAIHALAQVAGYDADTVANIIASPRS